MGSKAITQEFRVICYHCHDNQVYKPMDFNKLPKRPKKVCTCCGKEIMLLTEINNDLLIIKTIKEPKKCEFCGKQFIPIRIDQKYCDSNCRELKNHGNVYGKFKKINITCYHCFTNHDYKIKDINSIPKRIAKKCNNCGKYFYFNIDKDFTVEATKPTLKIQCDYCGISFIPKLKSQRFCSTKCRLTYRGQSERKYFKEKICRLCGNKFTPISSRQIYCSRKCGKKGWYKFSKTKESFKQEEKICDYCGITFITHISKKKYCSKKCRANEWYHKKIAKELKDVKCENCGKVFKQFSKIHRFCSDFCRDKKYYLDNQKEIKEKSKIYTIENKARILVYRKEYYEKNKKFISEKRKLKYPEIKERLLEKLDKYFKQTYDDCEKGNLKDALVYKIFDYLNHHPEISRKELQFLLYNENPRRVSQYYSTWVELTYLKYIKKQV